MSKLVKATCLVAAFGLVLLTLPSPTVRAQQRDVTPPELSLPGSITVEATSRLGVVVSFTATATDDIDPNPTMACNPASGLVFRLGSTTVNCTATDAAGNAASGSFPVTVRDITPPVLTIPSGIKAEASTSLGALVIYTARASDTVDPEPTIVCNPPSGSVFPIGRTTVSCTARDASGNVGGDHFVVTIGDASPPTIVGSASPAPNANGWNNTDVAVGFACTDITSGIRNCEGAVTFTNEGAGQSATGAATDMAGNTATAMVAGINIDKTAPIVIITSPAPGAQFMVSTEVLANWQVEDVISGVDSAFGTVRSGAALDTSRLGVKSFTVTARDRAGNQAKKTHTYTVLSPFAGFVLVGSQARVEAGAANDEFLVNGGFELGTLSNGLDVLNEEVTVAFNGYRQTLPAGSFFRNQEGAGFRFNGPIGSITRIDIGDDGEFQVQAKGLEVSRVAPGISVPFSLRIGDDVGWTTILFRETGPFLLETLQARDFFGTVASLGAGKLDVRTETGIVEVAVTKESKVGIRHLPDAALLDLVVGDLVAVSLQERNERLIASQVLLIPRKPQNKHVPGRVVALTDRQITVGPIDPSAKAVTFNRGPNTNVRFHGSETKLEMGSFVVVGAVPDPETGLLGPEALEINVTTMRPGSDRQADSGSLDGVEPRSRAKIDGVLQGIDKQGYWLVSGNTVAIGAGTAVKSGLAVGRPVKIAAELKPDGTLLARQVDSERRRLDLVGRTELQGIFERIDQPTGNWIIGGAEISVGPGADTDGVPLAGQLVKVLAMLQRDGSLAAREVENLNWPPNHGPTPGRMQLVGLFQGVDIEGQWSVNGAKLAVGPLTRLEGTPEVGRPIQVEAIVRDNGSLFALNIEGENRERFRPATEAEVRGAVEEIRGDGTLVVNGVEIARSIITEQSGAFGVGDFVEVEALILEDGSLVAREVELKAKAEAGELPESDKVRIEGTIDRVSEDGTLVVNGIRVVFTALSEVAGDLAEGGSLKVEGLLRPDGSVLARELKGEGRRATSGGAGVRVNGVVGAVTRDDAGNVVRLVVNGLAISLAPLTETVGNLEAGSRIELRAVIAGGAFLASKIEERPETAPSKRGFQVEVEGTIEAVQHGVLGRPTSVTVNGFEVVIGGSTALEGTLEVGGVVEIKGDIGGGILTARQVKGEAEEPQQTKRVEFKLGGTLNSVGRDDAGNVVGLVVDGDKVVLEALTRVKGQLVLGTEVEVEGIVSAGELLAGKVVGKAG